jgi:hypothetical protein
MPVMTVIPIVMMADEASGSRAHHHQYHEGLKNGRYFSFHSHFTSPLYGA